LVKIGGKRRWSLFRVRCPQPTVRWRLTLLYAVRFLVSGAALLVITYALVSLFRIVPSRPFQVLQGRETPREVRAG